MTKFEIDQASDPLIGYTEAIRGGIMKQGLFRTTDPLLGECVRTHMRMGDAYPLVSRQVYEQLKCEPHFMALPDKQEYEYLVGQGMVPPELPCYWA